MLLQSAVQKPLQFSILLCLWLAVVESRYSWGSGDWSAALLASPQLGCQGGLSQHACIHATGKVCICQDSDHAMGMKPFCSLQPLIDTLVFSHYVHVTLHLPDTEHLCQSEITWMNAHQQHASTFAPALTATTDSANTALPTTGLNILMKVCRVLSLLMAELSWTSGEGASWGGA